MFVGYENFSTFFVDADDIAASDVGGEFACFPNELKPRFQVPDPWFAGSACSGDFIVVAEFSELEGPVPRVCRLQFLLFVSNYCFAALGATSLKQV